MYSGKNEELNALILSITSTYNSEISLNLLQDVQNLQKYGTNFVGFITEQFSMLAKDKSWRTREKFVNTFTYILNELGKVFFLENLKSLLLEFLIDSAFAVREAAAKVIQELLGILGVE